MSQTRITDLGTETAVRSAFESFLKLLRFLLPILAAFSVALIVGAKTVTIQSFELSRVHAALIAIILLLIGLLGCYRATLTIYNGFACAEDEVFKLLRVHLLSESSIHNPFCSSSIVGRYSESSATDYIGLLAIHVPILIILITGAWAQTAARRDADAAISVIESFVEAPGFKSAVERAQVRDALAAVVKRAIVIATYFLFSLACLALYVFLLFRIALIIDILHYDDRTIRFVILGTPIVIFLLIVSVANLMTIRADWNHTTALFRLIRELF